MTKEHIQNRWMQRGTLIFVLIVLGLIIFINLKFFLSSFLGAFTLYLLLRSPQRYLTSKWKLNNSVVSTALIIITLIIFSGFGFLIFDMVFAKISNINTTELIGGIRAIEIKLQNIIGQNIIPADLPEKMNAALMDSLSTVLNTTYSFVANLVMMFFILFFMLTHSVKFEHNIAHYIPFSERSINLLKVETHNIILSNAIGIPVMMILQGILAALGYWAFGIKEPVFWGLITGVCSAIPVIGTTIIWIPLGVYLITSGNTWSGIGLFLFGTLVITNIDNVFRFILLKRMANVHPLITVFGVIVGVNLFSFWGIIFGPLLISIFLLLLKLYRSEYWEVPVNKQSNHN
jgi:predicted PurR-regulated permease PerM